MGGIMPDRERDAAIKRLKAAAEEIIAARSSREVAHRERVRVHYGQRSALIRMQEAWRQFPECERDDQVPSPEEVLRRCDTYDRQKEESERIKASIAERVH